MLLYHLKYNCGNFEKITFKSNFNVKSKENLTSCVQIFSSISFFVSLPAIEFTTFTLSIQHRAKDKVSFEDEFQIDSKAGRFLKIF